MCWKSCWDTPASRLLPYLEGRPRTSRELHELVNNDKKYSCKVSKSQICNELNTLVHRGIVKAPLNPCYICSIGVDRVPIREEDLPLLCPHDVSVKKRKIPILTIKKVLNKILMEKAVSPVNLIQIREYLGNKDWIATKLCNKLYLERKSK